MRNREIKVIRSKRVKNPQQAYGCVRYQLLSGQHQCHYIERIG